MARRAGNLPGGGHRDAVARDAGAETMQRLKTGSMGPSVCG